MFCRSDEIWESGYLGLGVCNVVCIVLNLRGKGDVKCACACACSGDEKGIVEKTTCSSECEQTTHHSNLFTNAHDATNQTTSDNGKCPACLSASNTHSSGLKDWILLLRRKPAAIIVCRVSLVIAVPANFNME